MSERTKAAIKRWLHPCRMWLRLPLRQKGWALGNWLQGYRLGAVRRHRCCLHTTPAHYGWCVCNGSQEDRP